MIDELIPTIRSCFSEEYKQREEIEKFKFLNLLYNHKNFSEHRERIEFLLNLEAKEENKKDLFKAIEEAVRFYLEQRGLNNED